jgi:hypothetical protein
MSMRTLFEINHDYAVCDQSDLLEALNRYLRSASREHAEDLERFGIRVIGMRHHSTNFVLDGEPDGFPVSYLPRRPGEGGRAR